MFNVQFRKGLSGLTCLVFLTSYLFFASCSVQKEIARSAKTDVLDTKALQTAHVGISIFEPATNKYWFNYQGDHYFVPASNTKLSTCYAAMKYLGDSLVGLRYLIYQNPSDTGMLIEPTGDPTFLHPDFKYQKVYQFLKDTRYKIGLSMPLISAMAFGRGWAFSDAQESYMPPRSFFPVYGNIVRFNVDKDSVSVMPDFFFKNGFVGTHFNGTGTNIIRIWSQNVFQVRTDSKAINYSQAIPLVLDSQYPRILIEDTLHKSIHNFKYKKYGLSDLIDMELAPEIFTDENFKTYKLKNSIAIHSQPTDSLLKPMMHHSDNFFAEQTLLMVSNERLGVMSDEKIIDTLLKTDFKDLPQKPRWVDGSGLSRYNLFTPQDFVAILNKIRNEFGMERIKVILATGGEGTISGYYKEDHGYIYGKTGTLSGVVAFSGYLYTKKRKLLIFSTLVNNHTSSATDVRRAVEKFLQGIRNKY